MVVNTAVNANSNVIPAVPMREIQAPSWWVYAREITSEIREAFAQTFGSLLSEAEHRCD